MSIAENFSKIQSQIPTGVTLVAVSKLRSSEEIQEAYQTGQRIFGENRVQELLPKIEALPKDIEWHLIGHLQTNKVKFILPFVSLIHSVDSLKLLAEINKEANKINRVIDCLLEIKIATEDSKYGLSFSDAEEILSSVEYKSLTNIRICGLMGMATLTENIGIVRSEFSALKKYFDKIKTQINQPDFNILSMGMSGDFATAMEEGSTMVRVGTALFAN